MTEKGSELDAVFGQHKVRVGPVSFLSGGTGVARAWTPGAELAVEDAPAAEGVAPAEVGRGVAAAQPEEPAPCPNCEAVLTEAEAQIQEILATLREPYLNSAARMEQSIEDLTAWVRRDLVHLAVRLAEAIVGRVVELDRTIAEESVAKALRVAGGIEAATVLVHPDDLEAIRGRAPELAANVIGKAVDLTVRASDEVALGSCLVHFEAGTVDARWRAQLLHLQDLIDAIVISGPKGAPGQGGPP